MIKIKKYDFLHIQIITDDKAYLVNLKDFFSDYVEGYKYMPRFKCGGWTGKICVLANNNTLPFGLLFDVIKFTRKYYKDVDISIDENVKNFFVGIDDADFDYNLNIYPRDYQIDCIETALKYKRCILRVATAGGKSLIISYIIKYLIDTCKIQRAIIIVPTQSLVEQFFKDMNDYGMDCSNIGRVYSKIKEYNKQIIISTWQSLSRKLEWIKDFDCIICDEVHGVRGVELQKILSNAVNADFRMGFTGTLPSSKLDMFNVKGFIGPVIKEYGSSELAEKGYISHCNIKYINICYKDREKYTGEYNDVKDKIFNNQNRLKYIKKIVSSVDNNILLLVGKVEDEGKILQKYLADIKDKEIIFIWGDTSVVEREKWRKECEQRKNIILIATYGILQVGVNIPSLKYLLFASPFKSKIRVLQSIGRTLRKHDTKDKAIIYDIADQVPFLDDHAIKRLRYYGSEKFEVEETTVDENLLSVI